MIPRVSPVSSLCLVMLLLVTLLAWTPALASDACSLVNDEYEENFYVKCNYRPVCYSCMRTDGCAFDTSTGKCYLASSTVSLSSTSSSSNSSSASNASSVASEEAGVATGYCSSSDSTCNGCTSNCPTGSGGCQCATMCESLSSLNAKCSSTTGSSHVAMKVMVILSAIVLLGALVVMRWRCLKRSHRTRTKAAAPREPPANMLQLSGWRNHLLTQSAPQSRQAARAALNGCYMKMDDGSPRESSSGATFEGESAPTRQQQHTGIHVSDL